MQYRPLGETGLMVSRIGLGTMTFGEQNSEREAHAQLDRALELGINLIDAAEMYPVPPRPETFGRTEAIVGSWLASRPGARERVVLATKVTGRATDLPWIRGGPRLTRRQIIEAVDGSLRRLRTDRIDLYQLHWPERRTNCFGQLGYEHDPKDLPVPLEETFEALDALVRAGKVRYVGVSNETPWGVAAALRLARELGWARIQAIQNPYSLLNRSFEVGLAEMAIRERVGLLAYSPLGFGVLSGKYLEGWAGPESRLLRYRRFSRYRGRRGQVATEAYVRLARSHGLDPAQMALAFVASRPFVTSVLIGATTLEQLEANAAADALELPPQVLEGIEAIHRENPNPCP